MRIILLLAYLLLPSAAFSEMVVHCDAGRWEGLRVGFRGGDGENGITYPSVTMVFETPAENGDLVFMDFGPNLFHERERTLGLVVHSSRKGQGFSEKSYLIVHSKPQQISEVFTVDLETGEAIMSQTIGDRHGISVDTFKKNCRVTSLETSKSGLSDEEFFRLFDNES